MRTILPALCAALLLPACGDAEPTSGSTTTTGSGGTGGVAIPEHVVNGETGHSSPLVDTMFGQDVATQWRTLDVMPDVDVRALLFDTGTGLWYFGTATGLGRLGADGVPEKDALPVMGAGTVIDLAAFGDGTLVLARSGGVEIWKEGAPGELWSSGGVEITSVAVAGELVFVGTKSGLAKIVPGGLIPNAEFQGFEVRDVTLNGEVIWMATDQGVKRWDVVQALKLPDLEGPGALPDDDARAIAADPLDPSLIVGTATGYARFSADGTPEGIVKAGKGGLPNGDVRAVASSQTMVLSGHGIGATLLFGGQPMHYHSRRWMPDEEVTAVALDGSALLLGTHQGLTRIDFPERTLEEKAALYEAELPSYFRMDGIVADEIRFADPYDLTTPPTKTDFDNDGLWTEMQIAAWCLAYAETKDEGYYESARRAMDTMFLFFDVPGETFAAKGMNKGFITRSLVRDDEGALFEEKASQSNWHLQKFGDHEYYWKDDTSSDEYAGHYFGIPLYYDLCAKDEAEKQAIRDRIALSTSYVVDGGYTLIDLDGKPTKFGRWDNLASAVDGDLGACLGAGLPNCAESYGGGGWLNSIEILGHLLAAWHITGDDKFYREYEKLAIDQRYGDMVPLTDHTFTVTSRTQQNHSDHELASLAYFTLLRYEPNADRRDEWKKSVLDFYGWEEAERNALEIAVIASAVKDGAPWQDAARTLREWPIDRRDWLYDNSHRQDVEVDASKDRFDKPQFTTVLPYDEMRSMKWNGNPYAVSGGGSGNSVQGPWPYLLPYWMMRHAKAIVAP